MKTTKNEVEYALEQIIKVYELPLYNLENKKFKAIRAIHELVRITDMIREMNHFSLLTEEEYYELDNKISHALLMIVGVGNAKED